MWPIAENKPKHILQIAGKPLIVHLLEALRDQSITDIVIVIGYQGDQIKSALADGRQYGVNLQYVTQPRRTGTASALKAAQSFVGSGQFLAIYGDLHVSASAIGRVVAQSRQHQRAMAIVQVKNPEEYGLVKTKADMVVSIREKASSSSPCGWVNAGIYVLDDEIFRAIDRTRRSQRGEYELTTSVVQMIKGGLNVGYTPILPEEWLDLGRPWDLLEANERALASLESRIDGAVEDGALLTGPVLVERGAKIKSGSNIEGPAYVGSESVIGPSARIRPSTSIDSQVTVGTSCEIKNSLIMKGSKVPHLSYIGDSILGESCNLGAGTITANIRFDGQPIRMRVKGRLHDTGRRKLGVVMGDRVQTGINVSIMPGVAIGSDSLIGPGAVIYNDVPSTTIIAVKQTFVSRRLRERQRKK